MTYFQTFTKYVLYINASVCVWKTELACRMFLIFLLQDDINDLCTSVVEMDKNSQSLSKNHQVVLVAVVTEPHITVGQVVTPNGS